MANDNDDDNPNRPPTRLYAISDVHVDDPKNMAWVRAMEARPRDALIVAGDVSEDLGRLAEAFRCLKTKYETVFFCPGNHEAWVVDRAARFSSSSSQKRDDDGDQAAPELDTAKMMTSLEKLERVRQVARAEGVLTTVGVVGGDPKNAESHHERRQRTCVVAPLLSWHHASFDTEPAITQWRGIPSARLVMADYRRCRWPAPLRDDDDSLARHVDALNAGVEDDVARERRRLAEESSTCDVISFSHFVPRIELIPEKRFLFLPTLAQAVGSRFLGDRVRRLTPDLHVYGHTHLSWDATIDGIRYVQAALAYPNEWKSRASSLAIGDLAVSPPQTKDGNDTQGLTGRPRGPLLIWDSTRGVVPHEYSARWSDYYKTYPRVPELTNVLPPYTARLYRPLPGSAVREVEDHVQPFAASRR